MLSVTENPYQSEQQQQLRRPWVGFSTLSKGHLDTQAALFNSNAF